MQKPWISSVDIRRSGKRDQNCKGVLEYCQARLSQVAYLPYHTHRSCTDHQSEAGKLVLKEDCALLGGSEASKLEAVATELNMALLMVAESRVSITS